MIPGNRLSMSKLWLAMKCGYFARPDVFYSESPPGRAARIGSVTHTLQEVRVTGTDRAIDNVNLEEVIEAQKLMSGPFGAWLDATEWTTCEIGFRYDAEEDESEQGPRRGEDGYDDHGPMVLKGTLDLVKVEDDSIDVVDTKTGQPRNAHVEQLYGQAVAAARFYKKDTVRVGFVFPRKTKVIEPVYETLDADRLDYEAGRIRRVLRTIPTAQPVTGDHCWMCPARTVCPAKVRDEPAPPDYDARVYDDNVSLF